jgi:hypothetical protein
MSEDEDYWAIAKARSKVFTENVFVDGLLDETKNVFGKPVFYPMKDKQGVSIWLTLSCLNKQLKQINSRTSSLIEDFFRIYDKITRLENELAQRSNVADVILTETDRELLEWLKTHNEYKQFAKMKNRSPAAVYYRLRKLQRYHLVDHIGNRWRVK